VGLSYHPAVLFSIQYIMGSPKFMGPTGRPLSLAASAVATAVFLLFGYDQGIMISLWQR